MTHEKNPRTMLWSTSPTNRQSRGFATKKDISNQPKPEKKSIVFRPEERPDAPPDQIFTAKNHTDAKKGRYMPDLQRQRDAASLTNLLKQTASKK